MNVIMLDAHREGDARIERHVTYLADQGLNVYRVHFNHKSDSAKPGVFTQSGVKGIRINLFMLQGKLRTLYFLGYCLRKAILNDCLKALDLLGFDPGQPSVIHVHDPQLLPLAGMLIKRSLSDAKVVYDRHEVYEEWIQYFGVSMPVLFEDLAKKFISAVVVVSERQIDTVQRLFPNSHIVAVPNYPLPAYYDDEVVNEKINLTDSGAHINAVYVGSLNNQADRDVDLLLKIADAAIRSYENVTFTIGGSSLDPESRARIDDLSQKHNGRFRFLGYVPREKTIELTEKAHIGFLLVRPDARYWVKGSPNKTYEYLMCGTVPIIRADVDHADAFKPFSLVFDRFDTDEAIIKAVLDLLGSPGSLKEYMRAAKDLSPDYTWESVACRYIELYSMLHSGVVHVPSARGVPLNADSCET